MAMRKCKPHDHATQADSKTARMFASRWDAVQFVPSSQKHSLSSRRSKRMSSKSDHSVQCNQSADDEPPCRFMFDHIMPLEEACEGYDMFDKMKVHKVVFVP